MLSDDELDQIWIHTMPNDTMSILRAVAEAAAKQALEDAADAWHEEHSGTRPVPYN